MNFYGSAELANFLNRDVKESYDKIMKVLADNNLDPELVMQTLVDVAQGKNYADNTVQNISKRLAFITTMDKEKTIYQQKEDGWIVFGTVHSEKQQYEVKKVEGRWYAKLKLTHAGQAGDDIAIQVNEDANTALEKLFGA